MYAQYSQLNRYREAKVQVRAVIYSRCSSDEQKKNGYTVKDQLDYGKIFAKEHGLIVVDEYVDEGISATLEIHKRKALAQLIKDAKAKKFDIVVFKCIDRFFRNTEEYYTAQKQLRKAGVTWLSIEEADLDPEDPDAAFKINIYLAMSEYEARKTSKRLKFNNAMRIKNKQVVTGDQCFLFPWHVVGDPKSKHLERNMDKAEALYDLLEHYETFQSKRGTVIHINTKYGENITTRSIDKLLKNTLLYGEYKGVPDYVEPYITKERYDNIQEIIKRNARHSKKTDRVFLFAGIIKCRCCGRKMSGCYQGKNRITPTFSYRCNKSAMDALCENRSCTSEGKIEQQLLENLEQYITNEIVRVESIEEKKTVVTDNSKKIEAIKKEMKNLTLAFRKGRIEEDEYDKEYEELEHELKLLEPKEEPDVRDLTAIKKLLESDFRTIYDSLDKPHKKAFWRATIKEFTIDENKKVVPESIIFF